MSLILANYPHRVESHFAGRSFANGLKVESIWRRTPSFGSAASTNDYVAVLSNQAGQRVVVSYSKMTSAMRAANPDASIRQLYNQAMLPGPAVNVAPRAPAAPQTVNNPAVATTPMVNTADVANRQAQIGLLINADTALDLMTALVKAARNDAKVANIVKSLSALV